MGIFIGGEGRSGTTLIRVIIDSHPNIACGPETHFFVDDNLLHLYKLLTNKYKTRLQEYNSDYEGLMARSFGQVLNYFHTEYMAAKGKNRWADKTPANILKIDFIYRAFPDMKFIHMIRDGRDVACSMLKVPWGPNNVAEIAHRWVRCVNQRRRFLHLHDHYLEVKYEDLIFNTILTLHRVFEFLDEPWSDEVLKYYLLDHELPKNESSSSQVRKALTSDSVGRWRRELTREQVAQFEKIAGGELSELGYMV